MPSGAIETETHPSNQGAPTNARLHNGPQRQKSNRWGDFNSRFLTLQNSKRLAVFRCTKIRG